MFFPPPYAAGAPAAPSLLEQMLPMAVIENCKPIGTPILSSVEQCRRDIVRSSREARRMSNLRII